MTSMSAGCNASCASCTCFKSFSARLREIGVDGGEIEEGAGGEEGLEEGEDRDGCQCCSCSPPEWHIEDVVLHPLPGYASMPSAFKFSNDDSIITCLMCRGNNDMKNKNDEDVNRVMRNSGGTSTSNPNTSRHYKAHNQTSSACGTKVSMMRELYYCKNMYRDCDGISQNFDLKNMDNDTIMNVENESEIPNSSRNDSQNFKLLVRGEQLSSKFFHSSREQRDFSPAEQLRRERSRERGLGITR